MKVAVTSTGAELDAQMDPRFGRAQYLLIVDTDSLEFEAIENPNIAAGAGAGIQTSQMIANKGAQALLTGNCGPNAYQTLAAAGVQVHVGLSGTVREAVEAFKRGELASVEGPSVAGHFGVGGGGGMGRGMGGGMGMGRGMGGGRGMGRGMGAGFSGPIPGPTPPASREEELAQLKEGAEALKQQLDQIAQRIEDLEEE